MRQFYGEDLVKSKKKRQKQKVKRTKDKTSHQVRGLNKAIFEPIKTNLGRDDQEQGLFDDFIDKKHLTIKEIVIRHQVTRKDELMADLNQNNLSSTVGCFKVKIPNPYAEDTQERSLQIKILDVLYNNQICSLVYMHDITSVMGV